MEWTVIDPDGVLNSGTRWTVQHGTPHTVRVIHGLYLSDTREDDLVIWTIEKHGVPERRPYSGRRRSFRRWEPAKEPRFEVGHTYRHIDAGPTGKLSRFLVMHVFQRETPGRGVRVIALKNNQEAVDLYQSDRVRFEDVTGKDGS